MNKRDFNELLESARQAVEIRKGRRTAARRTKVPVIDTREVRARLALSQPEFASLIGVSVYTVRNWEQGRRAPEGPARVLLQIAATNIGAVRGALAGQLLQVPLDWQPPTSRPPEWVTVDLVGYRAFAGELVDWGVGVPPLEGGSSEPAYLAA